MPPKGRAEWTTKKAADLARARVEFGQRVRQRREELGITQAELARICGVSRKTLNGIEYGHSSPSFPFFIALVRGLAAGRIPFIS